MAVSRAGHEEAHLFAHEDRGDLAFVVVKLLEVDPRVSLGRCFEQAVSVRIAPHDHLT